MAGGALVTALTLLIAIVGVWYAAKTYLIGWRGYFGFCETPSVLRELDQWTRRRLRAIVWKQWRNGPTRYAELRRRGVGPVLAAKTASSPRGP
ncbi:MAG TPA: group II intron maturase-specific domain-containing protein, partial [Bradyrhizobium sp.]|nr:group II intron maturase-specific domain-containing protein [Bradyrhizobium sp.]